MTQPIDVAFVEVHADTRDFSREVVTDTESAYRELEASTRRTTDNITDEFRQMGENVSGQFRDVNGRLRDVNGRFIAESRRATDSIQESATSVASLITQLFGSLASSAVSSSAVSSSAVSSITSALSSIVPLFLSVTSAAALAAIAVDGFIIAAAGIASIPGLVLATVGAFGILAAALSGIGKAFTELTSAQKKVRTAGANLAIQHRQEADAQRELTQAQRDLNTARQQALRDIERLNVDLAKARANQLRSADDLRKAEILLEQTRKVGTTEQINEATIAYEEAKAAALDAAQGVKELEQDKSKADKVGVEGSDRVLAALERVRDAQDRVAQSQQRIGVASAATATAFSKLTKNAQDFVTALVDAKNELGPLQDDIQETFFAGTGDRIQPIVDNIKALRPEILGLTQTFNDVFTGFLDFLGSPEFKDAAASALKGLDDLIKSVSPGVKTLLEGFLSLAGQFGETGKDGKSAGTLLGESLGSVLERIGNFLKEVDLAKLFEDAKEAVRELKPVVLEVGELLRNVFNIIRTVSPSAIGPLNFALGIVNGVINAIKAGFKAVKDFGDDVNALATKIVDKELEFIEKIKRFIEDLKNNIKNSISNITASFDSFVNKITGLGSRLFDAGKNLARSLFDGLASAGDFVKSFSNKIANGLIKAINVNVIAALNKGIEKIQSGFNKIPGVNLDLFTFPKIPELRQGGLVTADSIIRAGEGGRAEGVIPLQDPRALNAIGRAIANASPEQSGNVVFGPGSVVVSFVGTVPSEMEALRTGNAVGTGIASVLARQKTRINVRTLGTHG